MIIRVGDTVHTKYTLVHNQEGLPPLTPDIKLTVKQILGGVVMVLPWNSGHETMVFVEELIHDLP
jgi:hypothetical protein